MTWRRRLADIARQVATYLEKQSQNEPAPPPHALTLGLRLQRWHSLPVQGGLLDQPESLMQQIETALTAQEHWQAHYQRAIAQDAAASELLSS